MIVHERQRRTNSFMLIGSQENKFVLRSSRSFSLKIVKLKDRAARKVPKKYLLSKSLIYTGFSLLSDINQECLTKNSIQIPLNISMHLIFLLEILF